MSLDSAAATADRYRAFAEVEAVGLSACYEEWARGVAADPATLALIDRLPARRRQPNLVFSAARLCGAAVGPYAEFAEWLAGNWDAVEAVCLSHTTQTNEPARCAPLLPSLAELPGPLALIEVGASAGLCLYPDRYSYRYRGELGERMLDPARGRSTVVLDCEVTGSVPLPQSLPEVAWRAGIDLHPLDVRSSADVDWLDALIWPEHDDRRARLHAAVDIARRERVELVEGDLVERVAGVVAQAPAGASAVVFHTAVLAYLDDASRVAFAELMGDLPVTWLACEGQGVVPGVMEGANARGYRPSSTSEFVLARNGDPIAFAHPHGRALHWLE